MEHTLTLVESKWLRQVKCLRKLTPYVSTNIKQMNNRIKVVNFPGPPFQYSKHLHSNSLGETFVTPVTVNKEDWETEVEWMMRDVTLGGG